LKEDSGFRISWIDKIQDSTHSDMFKSVIIATGASARYLGLPQEKAFITEDPRANPGLKTCATCDGALFRNVPIAVIGGGDTACEEATFLTKYASKVYLVHRRNELRASKIMATRVLQNPKITPIWNNTLSDYIVDAKHRLEAVTLLNTTNGEKQRLDVRGVFMAIGHTPNTAFLKGTDITLDENGYIVVTDGCHTNVPGLFAAGDVRDHRYRQSVTAAGMGCMAALEAEHYLIENPAA